MNWREFQSKIGIMRSFHYPHYTTKQTKVLKIFRKKQKKLRYKERLILKYLLLDDREVFKNRIKKIIKDTLWD